MPVCRTPASGGANSVARILVAGGAGFIGSHLCDALIERGDTVVAVDNFCSGRAENVGHLIGHPRFELLEADICETLDVEAIGSGGRFSSVLDFASPASPDDFDRLPLEILAVGSTGTRRLLDLALDHGSRFFLASTSEVYGDPLVHPQPESYWGNVDPIGPRSCYDEAKRFSEALTMAYHRARGVDVRIARIFNTYGPRMRANDGRVITNFCMQALRDEPITVYGDGTQTRSFCYVDDEVRGLLALLDGPISGPCNIGSTDEITMLELARVVLEVTGSRSGLTLCPLPEGRQGDPSRRQPNLDLARSVLKFEPVTTMRDGLEKMVKYLADEV